MERRMVVAALRAEGGCWYPRSEQIDMPGWRVPFWLKCCDTR